MNIEDLFLVFWIVSPIIMFVCMLYGDYLEGAYVPPWQKKNKGVNSGAKFG